jgi:hypothetical protein
MRHECRECVSTGFVNVNMEAVERKVHGFGRATGSLNVNKVIQ